MSSLPDFLAHPAKTSPPYLVDIGPTFKSKLQMIFLLHVAPFFALLFVASLPIIGIVTNLDFHDCKPTKNILRRTLPGVFRVFLLS
jgi:hypothetical protein